MPFVSKKQEAWAFATKQPFAKEWASKTNQKTLKNKKKSKLRVNNKLKGAFGQMDTKTNKIEINVKAHKGDKQELASTIKHELMHVKHPKMTEKQVYKKTAKTKISPQEQSQLIAKLRMKSLNYKMGAAKRRFKLGKVDTKPGELINKYKSQKTAQPQRKNGISRGVRVGIMGMV